MLQIYPKTEVVTKAKTEERMLTLQLEIPGFSSYALFSTLLINNINACYKIGGSGNHSRAVQHLQRGGGEQLAGI